MEEKYTELINLGIDVNDGIRRFAGKSDLYLKSLLKFFNGISEKGLIGLAAAKAMDAEEFRRYIHGLKGVSGNLSLIQLNKISIEIEQSVKNGDTDFDKYQTFVDLMLYNTAKVREILASNEDPPPVSGQGSKDECLELLKKLNKYLLLGMAKECEKHAFMLREKQWDKINLKALKTICEAVDNYDYTLAMEMIENVE